MANTHWVGAVLGLASALGASGVRTVGADVGENWCGLLTPAQISGVVGATVGAGQPIGTTGCSWSAASPHVIVTISQIDAGTFGTATTPIAGVVKTPLSGVGDAAIYTTLGQAPRTLTTLSVKKGSTAFVVKLYGIQGDGAQMAMEKTLALDAVANT
jgi:hypothetical protein